MMIFCILLVFFNLNLFSNEIISAEFEEIIVEENSEVKTNNSGNSISVMTAADIEAAALKNIAEVINESSSVLINSNGNRSSINSVSIRSSRSNQVAILIDGVKISSTSTYSGYFDISKLPSNIVERVEIYKGGSSAKFGDGAIGGAINIITKKGIESYSANISYSTIDGVDLNFDSNFLVDKKNLYLSLSGEFAYNPYNLKIVGGDEIDKSYLGFFRVGLQNSTSKYDLKWTSTIDENFNQEIITTKTNLLNNINQIQWKVKDITKYNGNYSGNFSFNIYDLQYSPYNLSYTDEKLNFLINLNNQYSINEDFEKCSINFNVGFDYKSEIMKSISLPLLSRHYFSPNTTLTVAFADEVQKIGIFDFTFRFDGVVGDRDLTFPSFNGSLLFYFDKNSKYGLKNSVYNAFRAPTMVELYYDTGFIVGNSKLEVEKSIGYDLSFFFDILDCIKFEIGYFYRNENNTIFVNGTNIENLSNLDFNGFESSINFRYLLKESSLFNIMLSYTFNYGVFTETKKEFTLDHNHLFKSFLSYSYKKYFSVFTNIDYYSGYDSVIGFVDMSIGTKLGYKNFYIDFKINNLLDMELKYHNYTTVVNRSYKISVGYSSLF